MHATILALGSRGDILPYALLGETLVQASHKVRFITYRNFASLVASCGLDFHAVEGNAEALLASSAGLSLSEAGRNPLGIFRGAMKSFGSLAEGYARDLSAPTLLDTDVLINQLPGGLFGRDLAEKAGIPMVAASVIPLTPTKSAPMLAFPQWPGRFRLYNRATYFVAQQLVWQAFRPAINRWRQGTWGLGKAAVLGELDQLGGSPIPVLNGFSRHVVPRPADWGEHVYVTGYWFPEPRAWNPPPTLARFLDVQPPPVFVGFGSMPVRDPQRTTEIVLAALERAECRAILHAGWAGLGMRNVPDRIYQLEYAPYEWLFPKVSAVVHHGGSGTTAATLRAGKPAVVVPFVFDQFYWGERVHSLGVGASPVPFRELSAERLATAIRGLMADTEIGPRAAELAERIGRENGLTEARDIIATVVKRWRVSSVAV